MHMRRFAFSPRFAFSRSSPASASAEVVGKVGVDWTGNDIVVDAVADPEVTGVTCHVTYFDRGVIDRSAATATGSRIRPTIRFPAARPGRSRSAISTCRRVAKRSSRPGMSLIWKKLVVNRIYDKKNDTLIYLAHIRAN